MKFWKDKFGKELTFKEFLQRWRRGMENVTPLQQVNLQINATFIIIIGLCAGIVISIIGIKNLWWLMLILIGGLFNTLIQMLGLWQRKQILGRLYDDDDEGDSGVTKVAHHTEAVTDEVQLLAVPSFEYSSDVEGRLLKNV